jgi:hypothetical protein
MLLLRCCLEVMMVVLLKSVWSLMARATSPPIQRDPNHVGEVTVNCAATHSSSCGGVTPWFDEVVAKRRREQAARFRCPCFQAILAPKGGRHADTKQQQPALADGGGRHHNTIRGRRSSRSTIHGRKDIVLCCRVGLLGPHTHTLPSSVWAMGGDEIQTVKARARARCCCCF